MAERFSRRDFLDLTLVATGSLIYSSCVPKEEPTPFPTSEPTERPVSTKEPTPDPTETPNSTATSETEKTPLPAVEILDNKFSGSELLVDGLSRPETIVVNPVNGRVYFEEGPLIEGNGQAIYEFNNETVVRKYSGASDSISPYSPYRPPMNQTEFAINQKGELFIYSRTSGDERINVYDTLTDNMILQLPTKPFPESFDTDGLSFFQPVRSVAANPIDNRFYMSIFSVSGGPLVSLDPQTGIMERHTPENVGYRHQMIFDSSGTAYLGDVFDEYLDKIPLGGDGERFEFQNLREIVSDLVGDYDEFNISGLAYDDVDKRILTHGYALTSDYIERGGINYLRKIILAVDPNSHNVSPIALLNPDESARLVIGGLSVDNRGSIYFTTHSNPFPNERNVGTIFRLNKTQ